MKVAGLDWVWLYLLLLEVLAQTRAQILPPVSTSTSASVELTEDVGSDGEQMTHSVSHTKNTKAIAFTTAEELTTPTVQTPFFTTKPGAGTTASESPSVTPALLSTSTSQSPGHIFSSQPTNSSLDWTPSALSTQPLLVSLTTASAPTAPQQKPQGIAGPTHQERPSQLNVGDEDFKGSGHHPNSLDPLLAGLLSVFIVTTAVVFVVLFLKFRHQNSNPEFHRLQDLPMDDLMEDTPLSRYSY